MSSTRRWRMDICKALASLEDCLFYSVTSQHGGGIQGTGFAGISYILHSDIIQTTLVDVLKIYCDWYQSGTSEVKLEKCL